MEIILIAPVDMLARFGHCPMQSITALPAYDIGDWKDPECALGLHPRQLSEVNSFLARLNKGTIGGKAHASARPETQAYRSPPESGKLSPGNL
ncbi:hypothetical protein GCM10027343_01780 [Noviherbaspirillum agri]